MAQIKINVATATTGELATANIADSAVTTAKIAADAVTDAKVADDIIGTEHLTAGEVDTTALGADSVTAAKIADDAIGAEHIDDNAIGLAAMAGGTDGNVISYDASGNPVAIATGSDGEVLTSAGAGQPPAFEAVSAGTALTGSTNNTIPTVTGANAISGEANLTFDGTDLTVSTGNVVMGTSGKGIDFSAQTPSAGMTAELLDHYEEGTWTPSIGGDASYHSQVGTYTRIGRYIYIQTTMQVNVLGTGSTTTVSGLPFTITANSTKGGVNRLGNCPTNVVWLMPNIAATSYNFCGMTASAGTITDAITVFASGTQVYTFLVGETAA